MFLHHYASGRLTAKFVFFAFLVLFCAFEIQSKCPSSSALQRTKGQNRAKRERSGAAGNQSPKRKLKWSWKSKLPCQNDAFTTKYWGWSAGGRWKEIAEKWRQSTEVGQQERGRRREQRSEDRVLRSVSRRVNKQISGRSSLPFLIPPLGRTGLYKRVSSTCFAIQWLSFSRCPLFCFLLPNNLKGS